MPPTHCGTVGAVLWTCKREIGEVLFPSRLPLCIQRKPDPVFDLLQVATADSIPWANRTKQTRPSVPYQLCRSRGRFRLHVSFSFSNGSVSFVLSFFLLSARYLGSTTQTFPCSLVDVPCLATKSTGLLGRSAKLPLQDRPGSARSWEALATVRVETLREGFVARLAGVANNGLTTKCVRIPSKNFSMGRSSSPV